MMQLIMGGNKILSNAVTVLQNVQSGGGIRHIDEVPRIKRVYGVRWDSWEHKGTKQVCFAPWTHRLSLLWLCNSTTYSRFLFHVFLGHRLYDHHQRTLRHVLSLVTTWLIPI